MMEMRDLVLKCRSYRRFDGSFRVEEATVREIVAVARGVASAANRQPLKYILSCAPDWNLRIFETLAWAAYLEDWPGPGPQERPTAYVVILLDTDISRSADVDVGIAAQTILLAATERGLGGCMFGAVRRDELAARLALPSHLDIALVIALGKPVENVILEDVPPGGSIKYYRDEQGTHHVPKRREQELIHAVYSV
jgi:nitroreductase